MQMWFWPDCILEKPRWQDENFPVLRIGVMETPYWKNLVFVSLRKKSIPSSQHKNAT